MDIIYHANCLDGSVSICILFLYKHLHDNQLTKNPKSSFWELIIENVLDKPLITFSESFDIISLTNPKGKNFNGDLNFESFRYLPISFKEDEKVSLYPLDVADYDHSIKVLKNKVQSDKFDRKLLLITDASASLTDIEELSKFYKMIVIIDHHQSFSKKFTALKQSGLKNLRIFFSNTISAAALTYLFFSDIFSSIYSYFSKSSANDFLKKVNFVSINDISMTYDPSICSFIEAAKMIRLNKINDFNFMQVFKFLYYELKTLQKIGKGLLVKKEAYVNKSLKKFEKYKIIRKQKNGDLIFYICYGKFVGTHFRHAKEIGNLLAKKSFQDNGIGLAIIVREQLSGGYYISLKSTELDDFDCEELATSFGGGGHKRAAGFMIDEVTFKETIINVPQFEK